MLRPDGFAAHWLRPLAGNRVPNRFLLVDAAYRESPSDEDPGATQLGLRLFGQQLLVRHGNGMDQDQVRFELSVPNALELLWEGCSASRCTWIVGWRIARLLEVIDWWREIERGNVRPFEGSERCDVISVTQGNPGRADLVETVLDPIGDCPCAEPYRQCPLSPMVTADPPTILGCWWRERRIMIVDSRNYWSEPIEAMQASCQCTAPLRLTADSDSAVVRRWLADRLGALAWQWTSTMAWWMHQCDSTWSATTAGLAWNYFRRHHLEDRTILVHDDESALRMERLGYYGGEVLCGYVGRVMDETSSTPPPPRSLTLNTHTTPGGVVELDVRSLYPACLRETAVPVRLLGKRWRDRRICNLVGRYERWGVAHVRLRTDRPLYPCRIDLVSGMPLVGPYDAIHDRLLDRPHRTVFPVGRFDTVICGAELVSALVEGHVERVYGWCEYAADWIAGSWSDELWRCRLEMQALGDQVGERMVKLLANGLIGKFASLRREWIDRPDHEWPKRWDSWLSVNVDTREIHQWRTVDLLVQQQAEVGETHDSCPAIAAAVTAAARQRMRQLRSSLPPRCLYYQDTDSLWVAADRIGSLPVEQGDQDVRLGSLRQLGWHRRLTLLGIRCYWTDRGWTIAGLHRIGDGTDDEELIGEVCDGAGVVLHRGPGKGVRVRRSKRRPRVVDVGRRVLADGWTEPFEVGPCRG